MGVFLSYIVHSECEISHTLIFEHGWISLLIRQSFNMLDLISENGREDCREERDQSGVKRTKEVRLGRIEIAVWRLRRRIYPGQIGRTERKMDQGFFSAREEKRAPALIQDADRSKREIRGGIKIKLETITHGRLSAPSRLGYKWFIYGSERRFHL